jgi:hypothetical protein
MKPCKELRKNLEACQVLNAHLLTHVFRLQARVDELEAREKAREPSPEAWAEEVARWAAKP